MDKWKLIISFINILAHECAISVVQWSGTYESVFIYYYCTHCIGNYLYKLYITKINIHIAKIFMFALNDKISNIFQCTLSPCRDGNHNPRHVHDSFFCLNCLVILVFVNILTSSIRSSNNVKYSSLCFFVDQLWRTNMF